MSRSTPVCFETILDETAFKLVWLAGSLISRNRSFFAEVGISQVEDFGTLPAI